MDNDGISKRMISGDTRARSGPHVEKVPELVFGAIYTGKIVEVLETGVMIQLHPAMDPVMLQNRQLDSKQVSHPSMLDLRPGQDLKVRYYGRDHTTGQVRVSRKVLMVEAER